MNDNIVFIGMPGCGKSTLGIVVAKMLCMDFLDVDLLIQKRIGMSLQEYIDRYGVDDFLKTEADVICSLECENTLISTGGSAVLVERAAQHLSKMGRVVYLRLPYEDIAKRVKNLARRGVAMREGESLRDIYEYRSPIYEKYASVTVDLGNNDIASNCLALADILKA